MSQFLKMRNLLINTRSIEKVEVSSNAYRIFLTNYKPEGFTIFGFGYVQGNHSVYHIEKDRHPEDFKMVSDWMDTI